MPAGPPPTTISSRIRRHDVSLYRRSREKGKGKDMDGEFATSGFSDALVILGAAGIVIPAFARVRISPSSASSWSECSSGRAALGALTDAHPWLHYRHDLEPRSGRALRRARHRPAAVLRSASTFSFRRLGACARAVFGVGSGRAARLRRFIGGGLVLLG